MYHIYHKGFLLAECKSEAAAWEKEQKYQHWFTDVEMRKIDSNITSEQHVGIPKYITPQEAM